MNSLAVEIRERIYLRGELIYDSGFWSPNDLSNEGQAHILNVWLKEDANLDKYLMLLNMPGGSAPVKTNTYSDLVESSAPGANGYARQQILPADWSAPSLDAGNQQTTAAQKTFGQFSGNVPVSHVALVSHGTSSGTFFLWVSTAHHTAQNTSRIFVAGESYLVTLRNKQA